MATVVQMVHGNHGGDEIDNGNRGEDYKDPGMKLYGACMVMDKNLMIQVSSWTMWRKTQDIIYSE